jgi:hypothetical protein
MAGKMIKLMKASAEKLESVEGIDSGMAATIIETCETQQYIESIYSCGKGSNIISLVFEGVFLFCLFYLIRVFKVNCCDDSIF